MKRNLLLTFVLLTIVISGVFAQKAYVDPAAKYAEMLGYRYSIDKNAKGNEVGMCVLPDGTKVNAWDFYKGKVAQEYSYAAKLGFDIETETIKENGYVTERAVCIRTDKGEEVRIPLLELMEINGEALDPYQKNSSINPHSFAKTDPNFASAKSLPVSFDWRDKDGHAYIGGVRSQGSCGSCYSFGASAAAEGSYNVATGNYDSNCADFSEAYIAWCLSEMPAYSGHFSGCNGADYDYQELQALVDVGIVDESYFPYVDADNQSCAAGTVDAPKTKFENWYRVACADYDAIKTAIMTYGVVDAAVYVTTDFQNYSGGVYSDNNTSCSGNPCYNTTTNHAISLVGWGHDATEGDYWILRNSWGESWGEGGYMRLAVSSAHVDCSVCYLKYQDDGTTAPIVLTNSVSSIGDNTAICGGNITADGGATVISSGVVYSKTSNPTITSGTVIETSPTVTSGSYSITMNGLLSGTTYYVNSFATNAKGTSYGTEKTFTTTGTIPIEYCTSQGDDYSYEWIAGVVVGDFTNTSGASGYSDYTGMTANLNVGQTYDISLTPNFSGSSYNEYWKIWIDLNHDGDFDDANENVFDAGSMSKTTVNGSITIPAGTATVTTRMRVTMKYNAAPTACESSFSYGEVEDYTVSITTSTSDIEAPTVPTNLSSSNITETTFILSWNASSDNVGVDAYDIYKDGVFLASTTNTGYNVSGLSESTSYGFYVIAKDAAGNVSNASNTLNVTTVTPPDIEAPSIPSGLVASNIAQTSATISWNASSDNIGVVAYEVLKNGVSQGTVTSTTYNAMGLTIATTYEFTVKAKDAAGNVSNISNVLSFTTSSEQLTYCSSKGNNVNYEWIDLVELGNINNVSSGDGGYADNTNLSTDLSLGEEVTIYLSCGFKSSSYTEYWHVWIDYDHSGTFDNDEEMLAGSSSSDAKLYANFTVPTNALLGNTRMRVTMKYNSAATTCETFSYGEVEDYTVSITGNMRSSVKDASNTIVLGNDESTSINIYPIPANNYINVEVVNGNKYGVVNIYNINGMLVKAANIQGNEMEINISDLPAGSYIIRVEDEKEAMVKRFIKK